MSAQADVQAHALKLLGRENKDSPFPKRRIATRAQVRGFDPEEGPCCTAKKFRIDIRGTPASQWNASATKVFVQDFLTVPQHACRNQKKVSAMFRSHFKTLQRHFRRVGMTSGKDDDDDDDAVPAPQGSTSKATPNDIWFNDRNEDKDKGKGKDKDNTRDSADKYERKYNVCRSLARVA